VQSTPQEPQLNRSVLVSVQPSVQHAAFGPVQAEVTEQAPAMQVGGVQASGAGQLPSSSTQRLLVVSQTAHSPGQSMSLQQALAAIQMATPPRTQHCGVSPPQQIEPDAAAQIVLPAGQQAKPGAREPGGTEGKIDAAGS
jgi:hypothetical protein